jgi:hypothetical protein
MRLNAGAPWAGAIHAIIFKRAKILSAIVN